MTKKFICNVTKSADDNVSLVLRAIPESNDEALNSFFENALFSASVYCDNNKVEVVTDDGGFTIYAGLVETLSDAFVTTVEVVQYPNEVYVVANDEPINGDFDNGVDNYIFAIIAKNTMAEFNFYRFKSLIPKSKRHPLFDAFKTMEQCLDNCVFEEKWIRFSKGV